MCYESVLLDLFCPHSELSNDIFWVFVACVVLEKIEENRRSEIARSVIIVHECILREQSEHFQRNIKENRAK